MPAAKFKIVRKCKVCGEDFMAKTLDSVYCSPRCSKIAWAQKQKEKAYFKRLDELASQIPESKEMITVREAYALFGITPKTIRRKIREGIVKGMNLGVRKTYVSKEDLMKLYPLRHASTEHEKPLARLYRMEPEDCYTIGEVSEKFQIDDSTVYLHIRKYSIPTRQIGNYVYVPKREIDNLYKDIVL